MTSGTKSFTTSCRRSTLGQKTSGVRELREVVRRYPGTDEDRRARAKLKELNVPVTAATR